MRYIWLVFLFVFVIPRDVLAQETQIGMSPLKYNIIAKPGASVLMPFTLTNYADATLITYRLARIEKIDSLGNYSFLPIDEIDPLLPQLSIDELSEEPFLLLAKEQSSATARLEIPLETKEGDYYYALILKTLHSQGFETTSSIKMNGAVALPIFISVTKTGNIPFKLSPPEIHMANTFHIPFISKNIVFLDSKNAISGEILIDNTGNYMFEITPTLLLDKTHIPLSQSSILAHSRKRFEIPAHTSPFMGTHTLHVSVRNNQAAQSASLTFITFPFAIFFGLLFTIGCILSLLLWYKRYTNT